MWVGCNGLRVLGYVSKAVGSGNQVPKSAQLHPTVYQPPSFGSQTSGGGVYPAHSHQVPGGTEKKRGKENFGQHLLRCGGSLRSWEIRHPVRSLATTGMCLRTNGDSLGPGTAAARWGWKLGQRGATRVLSRQPWHALRCTGPPRRWLHCARPPRRWSHHTQGLAHIGPATPRAGTGFALLPITAPEELPRSFGSGQGSHISQRCFQGLWSGPTATRGTFCTAPAALHCQEPELRSLELERF